MTKIIDQLFDSLSYDQRATAGIVFASVHLAVDQATTERERGVKDKKKLSLTNCFLKSLKEEIGDGFLNKTEKKELVRVCSALYSEIVAHVVVRIRAQVKG